MIPEEENNIYPKSDENLQALITFYFGKIDIDKKDAIKLLNEKTFLSLNQCEFILKKLSEAYNPIFKKSLNGKITFSNLLRYGIETLYDEELSKSGSPNRKKLVKEFKEFAQQSEL